MTGSVVIINNVEIVLIFSLFNFMAVLNHCKLSPNHIRINVGDAIKFNIKKRNNKWVKDTVSRKLYVHKTAKTL